MHTGHRIPFYSLIILALLVPFTVSAEVFTRENWQTLPHPEVTSFVVHDDGSAEGVTETGIPFTQENVPNPFGVRIQKFTIQEHSHYIVEGLIAYSEEELASTIENLLRENAE